jgi:adenylate kinase family enzyme
MKIFLITGKPACGKDTQADLIAKKFKARKIITSAVIDEFLKKTKKKYITLSGVQFNLDKQKKIRMIGKLIAYRLVAFLVLEKIILPAIKTKKSIVLSGSPRGAIEAVIYLRIFKKFLKKGEYYFIYLNISDKTAIKRALGRQRSREDTPKVIKERLRVFRKEILPTINYLKRNKALVEINGENSKEKIFQEIVRKCSKFSIPH